MNLLRANPAPIRFKSAQIRLNLCAKILAVSVTLTKHQSFLQSRPLPTMASNAQASLGNLPSVTFSLVKRRRPFYEHIDKPEPTQLSWERGFRAERP
jgi:hypothetical protein